MPDDVGEGVGPLLERVLRGSPGLRAPETPAPDDATLVAYLCGALAPEDAAHAEQGLVTHPAARRRLSVVAARLDALQAASWADVEAAEDGVGRAWRDLAAARLAAAGRARDQWLAAGWEALRAEAAAGIADAQAAWAAFLSFADGWERARRVPRLAEARGAAAASDAGEPLPEGVVVSAEAEVDDKGDLTARVWVRDPAGQPSTAMDGKTVRLLLAAGGDGWPLADGQTRGGTAVWVLPDVGNVLHLPPGPLMGLRAVFGEQRSPSIRALFAADSAGRAAHVEVVGIPSRGAGILRLVLALPAPTRAAEAQSRLVVSATVAPGLHQRLGAWSVADWGDTPRTLELPCPGPDGEFDPATLRVDLEPAE